MFRSSVSRVVVALVFVLALVLSTVPVQALPLDSGSRLTDTSWLAAALSWLEGFFAGADNPEPLETMTAGRTLDLSEGTGDAGVMSSSCIDPWGRPIPCPEFPDGP